MGIKKAQAILESSTTQCSRFCSSSPHPKPHLGHHNGVKTGRGGRISFDIHRSPGRMTRDLYFHFTIEMEA